MLEIIRTWAYTLLLGLASLISFGKVFLYSHLLPIEDFAYINYFFIAVGVTFLLLGVGIVTRSHIEFVQKYKESKYESKNLVLVFQSPIIINGLISIAVLALSSFIVQQQNYILLYGAIIHSTLNLIFFLDIVYQKSTGDFMGYSLRLLIRNILILASGLFAFLILEKKEVIIYGELLALVLLNIKLLVVLFRNFIWPTKIFIKETLKYIPITLMAVLLQYSDRLSAAFVLNTSEFSNFSYYALIIIVGLTLQQIINTRFLRSITLDVMRDKKLAFGKTLVSTFYLFALQIVFISFVGYFLTNWFAPAWFTTDTYTLIIFILIAAIKGSDLMSGFCIASDEKKILFVFQISVATLILVLLFVFDLRYASLHILMTGILSAFVFCYFLMAISIYLKLRTHPDKTSG
ncbi:hypothetical protein [Kangiella geojedonensis]|uniref:Polysaccharide biosynthesis protein n=1 Tax=Kangiella geojedonensis TaxID=914150 RepID=A0A0F6RCF1_9GAMM|nr:hypothetical protein [Kangiella geojedonensis]AKE52348.1 hypothetical protein TQ33_1399 [Kangiella geojedonensis]